MTNATFAGPDWLPYAFPFLFVGVWIGIGWMNALVGGWRRLARDYRGSLSNPFFREPCSSASFALLTPASYGNMLTVAAGDEGLGLSVNWSFSLGNPPLMIPWSDVVECRSWRLLGFFDRFSFAVADTGVRVTLGGKLAGRVE